MTMERIGKYEILGELGRGGMGVVHKARDPIIGRTVAIKVILEEYLHAADIKRRFYREARSAGQLSHENITIIYDVGEENGKPYLVMEYHEGCNLRQILLEKQPLTFEDRIEIARQICSGLFYAHRHGVIHRDIKPENIYIVAGGRVKILDFGIARLQHETQTLTQTNAILGSPRYMSPEQIRGESLDGRSDIFAFGVLFYELLTGTNPFAGEHVTTVIYKVLNEDPPPLVLTPGALSRSLECIVRKCLEKERTARYGDCEAVASALEAVLASQDRAVLLSIPSPPPPPDVLLEAPSSQAEALQEVLSEKAVLDETMTRPVVSPHDSVEPPEEAVTDETPTRLVASVRKPLPPTPTGASPRKKTVLNKKVLAIFGIFLATTLAVGGYFVLNRDASETPITTSDPIVQQLPSAAPDTAGEPDPSPVSDETTAPEPLFSEDRLDSEIADDTETKDPGGDPNQGEEASPSNEAEPASDGPGRRAAEGARDAMDQTRRRVADRAAETEVAALFERAEARRRSGIRQFNAGAFDGAALSFRQASGLFVQIKLALDEKDAALDEETDTAETTEIISITARTRREDAERARTAMQAAKDNVPSDRQQTPVYQEAVSLEDQSEQFFQAGLYARAFAHFGQAEAKYAEAAVTQTYTTVPPELQAAVNSFSQTLKTSMEQEDSNGMRAMFYQDRDWRAFFEKAEAIAAAVSLGEVQISGNSATIPVQVALTYRDDQNQTQQETLSHLWTLQNMGGDWMITRVRPAQ
jgi:serine/threonine protein kinase